jgi:lysophospholipase L1-like esterase
MYKHPRRGAQQGSRSLCLVLSVLAGLAGIASAAPPIRVMPVGDSITYGSSVNGGYRLPLYDLLTNSGYNVDFIGSQTGNSTGMADPDHEGHGGWRIDQIDSILLDVLRNEDDPDVLLLLIGTNDFGQNYDQANATNRLDALIEKIATNRPFCKIVVANLLERGEPNNTEIQTEFNPAVPFIVSNHAARGQQVYFDDLRSAVPVADMPDNLHPGALGYAKMATNWFGVITNHFSPFGSTNPPAIVRAQGAGWAGVRVTFSKPVGAATATNPANYGLSGGVTVLSAALDPVAQREVVLTTSEQTPSTDYTLTVNNVADQTAAALPIAAGSTKDFSSSPPRGVFANIPEASEYALVYSLDIPDRPVYSGAAAYTVDLHDHVTNFTRVAYYMELQASNGPVQYVWVAMDPFTNVSSAIGIPTVSSGAVFQQPVTNLDVKSSEAAITAGTALSGGNLEFWPWNYNATNAASVPNAVTTLYDWGDQMATSSGSYGSMQVHNHDASQVLLAFNHWGGSVGTSYADVGIGNGGGNPDWTFSSNANLHVVKTLQVLALPADTAGAPVLVGASGRSGWTNVVLQFSEPLDDGATNLALYAIDGGLSVLEAVLDPVTKTRVTLTTPPQAQFTTYTVTVNGVVDRSALAVPIAADSEAAFTSAADRGVLGNVPEVADYTMVYSLDIPNSADFSSNLIYTRDNREVVGAFDRVAYYLELQTAGGDLQFAWVSMEAFTNSARCIGVPTAMSGAVFQQPVTNMIVRSNASSVTGGTNATGGNIEFWPSTYNAVNAVAVPGASDSLYDWGDNRTSGNFGSMQVHNHAAGEVILAFNHWGTSGAGQLGIGNNPGAQPDWTFQDNDTTYTVKTLQVFARPATNVPPEIVSCTAQAGATTVVVRLSKALADSATNSANYAVSGGVSVLAAVLDPLDRMRVTLTTSPQAPGTRYTIAFSGLEDITSEALPMAPGTTADFVTTSPPGSGALQNVPAARDFTLVYSIALSNAAAFNNTGVPYDIDNHGGVGGFSRVAYYLELVQDGTSTNFVWAEMDPFTQDAAKIGIPALGTETLFQQAVSNLTVYCSVPGVAAGDFPSGYMEFWPFDYTQVNEKGVLDASSANFDWGDRAGTGGGYGSMQVHNPGQTQVVMAVNNFGSGGTPLCLGIGSYPTNAANSDWTHIRNGTNFTARMLQVYVLSAADTNAPVLVSAVLAPDGEHITVRFSEPLADGAVLPGNFSLSGGLAVLAAVAGRDGAEVVLTITPATPGAPYTLSVAGVRDRSPNANPIAAGAQVAVAGDSLPAHVLANVPETAAYRLVYLLDLPVRNARLNLAGTTYDVDDRAAVGTFDRVAYYLELAAPGGSTNWVYASMDAFTTDAGRIGIPDFPSGAVFQQIVTNMNVRSSDASIVTGDGIETGNLEFWPHNYSGATTTVIQTGNAGSFLDWNDSTNNLIWAGEGHGSMQIHNHGANGTGQVLFAYNNWGRWGSVVNADLGIGTRPGVTNMDWTGAANGIGWFVKNLYVMVRPAADAAAPVVAQVLPSVDGTNLLVRFDEPVTTASAVPANFALDGGAAVLAAALKPNLRDVLLTTSPLAPSTGYTLTINNVMDRSSNSNTIPADTAAPFATPDIAPVFGRVQEVEGYELVYKLAVPSTGARYNALGVNYAIDHRSLVDGPFDRVAYYLEMAASPGAATNWVYASFDAMTRRVERVGVPALGTAAGFQQRVMNMNVRASDPAIVTGDGIATGNIEFWPYNYGGGTTTVVQTGGGGYDWNDTYIVGSGQHACMQVHNWGANETGQVLFAYNNWGTSSGGMGLGIGTKPAHANMDWTSDTANSAAHAIKDLYVLVRRGDPSPAAAKGPSIVTHPAARLAQIGGAVRLAGAAVGDAPLAYQWRFGGTAIPGATNAWFDLAGLGMDDEGAYDLVVANAAGSSTSLVADIEVNRPPTMTDSAAGTAKDQVLSLAVAKLLTYGADPDGDALAVGGAGPASTNGGAVALAPVTVDYTPPAGYVGQDLFPVVISDGRGGSVTGRVSVTVTTGEAAPMNIVSGPTITGGVTAIRFAGIPGYTYIIEATPSILVPDWQPVTNMVAPSIDRGLGVGIFQFVDPDGVTSQRYYRTISPP